MGRLLAMLVLAVAVVAADAVPAAARPARNGPLVFLAEDQPRDSYSATVVRVAPSGHPLRRRDVCGYNWPSYLPFEPDCTEITGLAPSPDGHGVTLSAATWQRHADGSESRFRWVQDLAFGGPQRWRWSLPAPTSPDEQFSHGDLVWSPDGRQLLITRTTGDSPSGKRAIELFDADGTDRGQLIDDAWSPDVSAKGGLAFIRGGNQWLPGNLYVQPPRGSVRRLTKAGAADPSWSPDGRRLAFTRRCPPLRFLISDDACVYVMPAGGGKPRLLARRANDPVWSPDGSRIAFFRQDVPLNEQPGDVADALFTVVVKTRRVRRLASTGGSITRGTSLAWLARR